MRRVLVLLVTVGLLAPALGAPAEPSRALVVRVPHKLAITRYPGVGRVIGWMPARSRYYRVPMRAWVMRTAAGDRYGKVQIPYTAKRRFGWIDLRGLTRSSTAVRVAADLSEHRVVVWRAGHVVLRVRAATGAPSTPTPTGDYFVTDRVPFPASSSYGSFAFGISGIQPHLPAGWSAGDQLAIHGTNDPSSIGRSVSAGCLRVSRSAIKHLKPLLKFGTPVVISP